MARWSLLAIAFVPALLLLAQMEPGSGPDDEEVIDVPLKGDEEPGPGELPDGGLPGDGGLDNDAGEPPSATELEDRLYEQEAEIEKLRAELKQMQDREDALQEISDELSGLREQVGDINNQVDTYGSAAVNRVQTNDQRVQLNTEGIDALRRAANLLAYGVTEGVDDEIEFALRTLTGSARDTAVRALELVRRSDYFNARTQLNFALEFAVRSQVAGTPAGGQVPGTPAGSDVAPPTFSPY